MYSLALRMGPERLIRLFLGSVFALVGVGLLVGAAISYRQTQQFLTHSIQATGTVISLERGVSRNSDGETSVTYTPVVRYAAADGQEHRFASSMSSSPPAYQVGQEVSVRYDPAPPFKAEINDFLSLNFGTLICGLMGTIFAAIGGFMTLLCFIRPSRPDLRIPVRGR
jgi:hypothetical protein